MTDKNNILEGRIKLDLNIAKNEVEALEVFEKELNALRSTFRKAINDRFLHNEFAFRDLEVAKWPNPGYDEFRFGIWFTLDGFALETMKVPVTWPGLLRALADEIEKTGVLQQYYPKEVEIR